MKGVQEAILQPDQEKAKVLADQGLAALLMAISRVSAEPDSWAKQLRQVSLRNLRLKPSADNAFHAAIIWAPPFDTDPAFVLKVPEFKPGTRLRSAERNEIWKKIEAMLLHELIHRSQWERHQGKDPRVGGHTRPDYLEDPQELMAYAYDTVRARYHRVLNQDEVIKWLPDCRPELTNKMSAKAKQQYLKYGYEYARQLPESLEDEDEFDWKDVIKPKFISTPTLLKDVPDGSWFQGHNGEQFQKLNGQLFHNGDLYTLGNPEYLAYPFHWDKATIGSFGRNYHKSQTEDIEDDDTDWKDVEKLNPAVVDRMRATEIADQLHRAGLRFKVSGRLARRAGVEGVGERINLGPDAQFVLDYRRVNPTTNKAYITFWTVIPWDGQGDYYHDWRNRLWNIVGLKDTTLWVHEHGLVEIDVAVTEDTYYELIERVAVAIQGEIYNKMYAKGWMRVAIRPGVSIMMDGEQTSGAQWDWLTAKAQEDRLKIVDDRDNLIADYSSEAEPLGEAVITPSKDQVEHYAKLANQAATEVRAKLGPYPEAVVKFIKQCYKRGIDPGEIRWQLKTNPKAPFREAEEYEQAWREELKRYDTEHFSLKPRIIGRTVAGGYNPTKKQIVFFVPLLLDDPFLSDEGRDPENIDTSVGHELVHREQHARSKVPAQQMSGAHMGSARNYRDFRKYINSPLELMAFAYQYVAKLSATTGKANMLASLRGGVSADYGPWLYMEPASRRLFLKYAWQYAQKLPEDTPELKARLKAQYDERLASAAKFRASEKSKVKESAATAVKALTEDEDEPDWKDVVKDDAFTAGGAAADHSPGEMADKLAQYGYWGNISLAEPGDGNQAWELVFDANKPMLGDPAEYALEDVRRVIDQCFSYQVKFEFVPGDQNHDFVVRIMPDSLYRRAKQARGESVEDDDDQDAWKEVASAPRKFFACWPWIGSGGPGWLRSKPFDSLEAAVADAKDGVRPDLMKIEQWIESTGMVEQVYRLDAQGNIISQEPANYKASFKSPGWNPQTGAVAETLEDDDDFDIKDVIGDPEADLIDLLKAKGYVNTFPGVWKLKAGEFEQIVSGRENQWKYRRYRTGGVGGPGGTLVGRYNGMAADLAPIVADPSRAVGVTESDGTDDDFDVKDVITPRDYYLLYTVGGHQHEYRYSVPDIGAAIELAKVPDIGAAIELAKIYRLGPKADYLFIDERAAGLFLRRYFLNAVYDLVDADGKPLTEAMADEDDFDVKELEPTRPRVSGHVQSDDDTLWVDFDATPWFQQVSPEALDQLASSTEISNKVAELIALWLVQAHPDENEPLSQFFGDVRGGYEAFIDFDQAKAFIRSTGR